MDVWREVQNVGMLVDEAARQWNNEVVLCHYESGREITYGEVARMSNRVGHALRAEGVCAEQRVAVLMDDSPEWLFALFGTLKIGAIPTPLNTLLTKDDYAFFMTDARVRLLFVDAAYLPKVAEILPALPQLTRVVVMGGAASPDERFVDWASFIQGMPEELTVEQTLGSDVAIFIYTSGSTGRPRAIMHSHLKLTTPTLSLYEVFGMGRGDFQFNIPKLYFLTSLGAVITAFKCGSKVALLSGRPTAETVLDVVARYRPTFLNGSPTIYARMVEAAREKSMLAEFSSVRYVYCTGEVLSPELFSRFKEVFGKPIYNCWGAQELACAPLSWRMGEEVPLDKVGSAGKSVLPGMEVKIVDRRGRSVPDGTPGEIMLHVPVMFMGYWHEPREAHQRIVAGWYKPGDSFVRDRDGYYWYLGRLDNMVKVGGRQVFPAEVERTISRHPAVHENCVVPVKNPLGLSELHAFIILKEGQAASTELATQIREWVKEELSPFKSPRVVTFVDELPRTATGKIQRVRLRDGLK